jgi:hypothetical protein
MNKRVESIGPKHVAFMETLKLAVEAHPDMSELDLLVCAAQFCGNIAAMQSIHMSSDDCMTIIVENIKLGNRASMIKIAEIQSNQAGKPN